MRITRTADGHGKCMKPVSSQNPAQFSKPCTKSDLHAEHRRVRMYAIRLRFSRATVQNDRTDIIFLIMCRFMSRRSQFVVQEAPKHSQVSDRFSKNIPKLRQKPRHFHAPRTRQARTRSRRTTVENDRTDRSKTSMFEIFIEFK